MTEAEVSFADGLNNVWNCCQAGYYQVLLYEEHREHDVQRAQEPRAQNVEAQKVKHFPHEIHAKLVPK